MVVSNQYQINQSNKSYNWLNFILLTLFLTLNQKHNMYLGKQVICFREQNCFN